MPTIITVLSAEPHAFWRAGRHHVGWMILVQGSRSGRRFVAA